jgi:hypothetical protein
MRLTPDHPPASITWRGKRRRIKRGDGPERVFGEWWTRDAEMEAVRDYYAIEDEDGRRFWVYRSGDGVDLEPERRSASCTGSSVNAVRRAAGHQQLLVSARRFRL